MRFFFRYIPQIWWITDRLRKLVRARLSPVKIAYKDCEFMVHPADNFTEYFLWLNRQAPEHFETELVAEMIAGKDVIIVDVGANAGVFFLPVLKASGKSSRAIVFEPNPVMLERLRQNIALNGFDNVEIFDCAISDEPGESPLFFPETINMGQGRISVEYNEEHSRTGIGVAIRTLPECLKQANVSRIDFLKVDVEGLEDRVIVPLLNDSANLLPKLIYFEVAHRDHWKLPVMQTLKDKGYRLIANFHDNHLYELKR